MNVWVKVFVLEFLFEIFVYGNVIGCFCNFSVLLEINFYLYVRRLCEVDKIEFFFYK